MDRDVINLLYWLVETDCNLNEEMREFFKEVNKLTDSNIKLIAELLNKKGYIKPRSHFGLQEDLFRIENLVVFANSQDKFVEEYGENTGVFKRK